MKHVIIGTAGHVDHGKTTLIQALTGTNTDRLKEEQERGMTIDIGFAALKLPDGNLVGIVDVPGHERFLKNMLAGAGGIDVVLLVIAADESVMPQTLEHLDILRLLDVRNGVVALTKTDLVEREWIEEVEADIRSHLKGSFLDEVPIIRVSATTGRGLEALKRALLSSVGRTEARNTSLPFRLPIDRVFTRPGFGTVVTGTLVAGTIRVGDSVEILPQRLIGRVRGLQLHSAKASVAEAGTRVAVNLSGVDTHSIERGAQLCAPGSVSPTTSFDGLLRLLPSVEKALKDRSRVRVHIGTAEIIGRIRILDNRTELVGGERCYVQFRGEEEFACARGDRFVLRTYSPMQTLGGGSVLDASPVRRRKSDPGVLETLTARERGTPEDLIESYLLRCPTGCLVAEVVVSVGVTSDAAGQAISDLKESGKIEILPGDRLIHTTLLASLTDRVTTALRAYHEQFALRTGIPKEELRTSLGKTVDSKVFASLQGYWGTKRLMVSEGATVRLMDFQVSLNERQQSLLDRIEGFYLECGIASPTLDEVCREVKAPPDAISALLKVGQERGVFVRVSEGVYYDRSTVRLLQDLIRTEIAEHGSLTVGAFRDRTQTNRRFALQALEYFDGIRFTRREGDIRTLW